MDISRFIITALALERASVLSTAGALETKTNSGPSLSVIILVWVSFCSWTLLRTNAQNVCGVIFQLLNFMKFKEMTCFAGSRLSVISSVNLAAACYLPKETGPCRGYFVRYFYDLSTGRCQLFAYGGCQGNNNNFKTFEECSNHCVVSENHFCCCFKEYKQYPRLTPT